MTLAFISPVLHDLILSPSIFKQNGFAWFPGTASIDCFHYPTAPALMPCDPGNRQTRSDNSHAERKGSQEWDRLSVPIQTLW